MKRFILTSCCALCLVGCKTTQPLPPGVALFDGASLAGWTCSENGQIRAKDGVVTLGLSDGCTGIVWTNGFPTVNYEVHLDAMRIEGYDFFCGLTFPVKQRHCTLIVGGWGGQLVGLSCIDGHDASENDTTRVKMFDNNRWYRIRIRVTDARIEAWINEEQVVNVEQADHVFSLRSEVMDYKPLGIASWRTTAGIRNIYLNPLSTSPAEEGSAGHVDP